VLHFKALIGVVFKPHLHKYEDFHPAQTGRQDPTENEARFLIIDDPDG
jgi:hypothetical protein